MKNMIRKNSSVPYYIYVEMSLALFYFVIHIIAPSGIGDDVWFKTMANTMPLTTYLQMRYTTWTSRVVLEMILITLLKLPKIVWAILDTAMFLLLYKSIVHFLHCENDKELAILCGIMLCIFPINYYNSAGWVTTTVNYIWPLALGFWVLSHFGDCLQNDRFNKKYILLCIPAILIAGNQEQMSALLCGFSFVLLGYSFWKFKKVNWNYVVVLLLSAGTLVFHMVCPGNAERVLVDISDSYPAFAHFGLIDKVYLGVLSTFSWVISKPSYVLVVFLLELLLIAWKKRDYLSIGIGSAIGFLWMFLISELYPDSAVIQFMQSFLSVNEHLVTGYSTLYFGMFILVVILLLAMLYRLASKNVFLIVSLMMCAALMSRVVLGFSPSLFVSGKRTFLFMYMLIIVGDLFVAKYIQECHLF